MTVTFIFLALLHLCQPKQYLIKVKAGDDGGEDLGEIDHSAEEDLEEFVNSGEEELETIFDISNEDHLLEENFHPKDEPAEEIVHPVEEEIVPESKVDHEDIREKEPEEAKVVENRKRMMFRTKKHHPGSDDKYGTVECKYNCAGWPDKFCSVSTAGTLPSNY